MKDYKAILNEPEALKAALRSLQLTPKQRADLGQLYLSRQGVPTTRDKGNRVRGETVSSCSTIGGALNSHFQSIQPKEGTMMWVGHLTKKPDGTEYWVMRKEVREALKALGWY